MEWCAKPGYGSDLIHMHVGHPAIALSVAGCSLWYGGMAMSLLDKATQVIGTAELAKLQQRDATERALRDAQLLRIKNYTGFDALFAGARDMERPRVFHERYGGTSVRWETTRELVFDVDSSKLACRDNMWFLEVPCSRTCGHQALVVVTYYPHGIDSLSDSEKQKAFIAHIAKMVKQFGHECAWCKVSIDDYCHSCGRGNR